MELQEEKQEIEKEVEKELEADEKAEKRATQYVAADSDEDDDDDDEYEYEMESVVRYTNFSVWVLKDMDRGSLIIFPSFEFHRMEKVIQVWERKLTCLVVLNLTEVILRFGFNQIINKFYY